MDRRALGLWLLLATLLAGAWLLPPIPQPQAYHDFADESVCLSVPHCLDTLSNLPFALAGLGGLAFLAGSRGRRAFIDPRERLPYLLFFLSVVLVGFASGHYHLAPDDARLVWDRAAISAAMMSWLAAIMGERVGPAWGLRLLAPLVLAGLAATGYWGWSEAAGRGDLRPYLLVQLAPMLFVPLLLRVYPARYSGARDIMAVLVLYAVALACDFLDRPIFGITGFVGGHTIKHLVAATAAGWVAVGLARRLPLLNSQRLSKE